MQLISTSHRKWFRRKSFSRHFHLRRLRMALLFQAPLPRWLMLLFGARSQFPPLSIISLIAVYWRCTTSMTSTTSATKDNCSSPVRL